MSASAGAESSVAASAPEQPTRAGTVAGRTFGAVTVLPALLAMAWLLPGLPLVLTNRFAVLPMVYIAGPVAVGLCYVVLRRMPAPRGTVPWWTVAATVAVAVVFAAWQIWMRSQQIIYLRDPATYFQVGYWIAHHGSLPVPQAAAAFGGSHPGLSFASMTYAPRGTGIVPQVLTGFPVVVAGAVWLGGIPGALVITPVVGGCAILAFGGLAGRLAGARWAPAAALVLALSLPQIYTSRGTFSEPLTQLLLFGGLSLVADSLLPRVAGQLELAGVAGLALGLTTFIRLDGLSDILPAVPFLGVLLAARRRPAAGSPLSHTALPFGAGLVIGVGYGLLDGYRLSRPYLDLEQPSLHPLALITTAVVIVTVAGVLVAWSPRARGWVFGGLTSKQTGRARRWLPEVGAVLTLLIFAGFAIRPLVQTVAGETNPSAVAYVAELQQLAHLPVDGRQQYYQDSLYWAIWYIGVPTVLLGAFGLAVLVRQNLRALLTWRDPDGSARIWVLPLLIALWLIVSVLYRPAISPDQPWASTRLVPFVLPGLILGAVWAASWLKGRAIAVGAGRATVGAVACCAIAALAIPTAWTTFGISLTPRLTARGMAFKRIGVGEVPAVSRLCEAIGSGASVVILDQLTADRFAQLVRGQCDTPAAVLPAPAQGNVAAVVSGIRSAGRRPVLLAQSGSELTQYGATPAVEIINLLTTQEAHLLTMPPTGTWGIQYTLWMSAPSGGSSA